jgi:hypothetical protein
MNVAARLLSRLANVRETASSRWIASCPTSGHPHGDRSRGLSIREVDDRLLIYCHAGCGAAEILEALGLTLSHLYEQPLSQRSVGQIRPAIPASDLLLILDHELTVIVLILDEIVTRRRVNEGQLERLTLAAARISKARDMINPAKVSAHAA